MAALYYIGALLFAFRAQAAFFGGASSIASYGADLINSFKKANPSLASQVGTYDSVGSGAGISGFLSNYYKVGASDEPLDNSQDASANRQGGKVTVPITMSTFNIMTKRGSGIQLSASQVARIYRGQLTSWGSVKSGLSGTIIPVARSEGSGTTKVLDSWLVAAAGAGWRVPSTSSWSTYLKYSRVVYARGTTAVVNAVVANRNALTYTQTGAGLVRGLLETAILNRAGKYVLASKSSPAQSIPSSLPPSTGNWNGVTLVHKSGASTYPIVSFAYTFAMIKKAGRTAKLFLLYTQSSYAQNLQNGRYEGALSPVPQYIRTKSSLAIPRIVG